MHGLVLGKFMPPHKGHGYLIDFARNFTADLTVVVGSLNAEPIPGELRVSWMRELFPSVRVLHLTDENPQYPEEHPDFWTIWQNSLQRIVGSPVDLVFAGEDYGSKLAEVLGARFIPASGGRSLFKVSGRQVRAEPFKHWDSLSPVVRAYFVKRVLIEGGELAERVQLCQELAKAFDGVAVPNYASKAPMDRNMFERGQWATEQALARSGARILFCSERAGMMANYNLVAPSGESQTKISGLVSEMLRN